MRKFLSSKLFKVLFAIGVLAIFIGSIMPGKQLPSNLPWDKALHFIGYFGLGFLARMGSVKRPWWLLMVACIGFSLIIELLQMFIPNRGFEWMDLAANSLGVICGVLMGMLGKKFLIRE
ncbi:VanZ family protein [Kangiella marina]|uniref:VanZ-like domain-containing protein n=1 Tax=Kangiella marina TaxID=1079178 RepID=A0ABP8IQ51_9GAMM